MSRCCSCEQHDGSMVETMTHEGAIVCTFRFEIHGDQTQIRKQMENFIGSLWKRIQATGGFIGHIKANAMGIRYSITSGKLDCLPTADTGHQAEGVAIVFRLQETTLKQLVITEICKIIHPDFEF